jgi:uncharacterized repeat protein (TIGR02543 family)
MLSVKKNSKDYSKPIIFLMIVSLMMGLITFIESPVYADDSISSGAVEAVESKEFYKEDKPKGLKSEDEPEAEEPEEYPEYKVGLNGMGALVSPIQITVTVGGIYANLPLPKKTNYDFKGWYTDTGWKTEVTSGAIVTDPVPETLYAKWEGVESTITLDPARAILGKTKYTIHYGESYFSLPKPKRKGLVFMGWFTKKVGGKLVKLKGRITTTTDNTYYAKWAPKWYMQTDKRWRKKWYRVRREGSTIGNAGCGPTTMAMVVASLKNTKVTPVTACRWSKNKRYKAYMSGTKDGFFKAYGKKYKIKVTKVGTYDLRRTGKKRAKKYHDKVKRAVKNGKWVVVLAGKGKWTGGSGHFILWYKTEGNYALIRDANSKSKLRARAKVSTLQKQVKRYWIIDVPEDKKVN